MGWSSGETYSTGSVLAGCTRSLASQLSGSFEDVGKIAAQTSARAFSRRNLGSVHRVAAENLGHVLVQPIHLVLSSVAKFLDLHVDELGSLFALSLYPLRRADRSRHRTRRHCCLTRCCCASTGASQERVRRRVSELDVELIRLYHVVERNWLASNRGTGFEGAKMRPRSCFVVTWMFILVNSGTHHFILAVASFDQSRFTGPPMLLLAHHCIIDRTPQLSLGFLVF
jgi:hypothetical protein